MKMPATTAFSISILRRIRRRFVPVSALSVVLVITMSSGPGASSGTICESSRSLGSNR